MVKKLSVAFVWHLHQPDYKDPQTGKYLMPWVRLHAIKDYLDMLLILDEFPNIKQTFNIVPLLMDQLEDYANGIHDLHSELTIKDVEDLTEQDKLFILNSFFDANYNSMIEMNDRYKELYEKRYSLEDVNVKSFSDEEYSDIMMWFNLVWFDPYWKTINPELKALIKKEKNYTLEDRIKVIDIQRDIIKQIIPSYKERFNSGKIEISTSPYYHSILPILLDSDCVKDSSSFKEMPKHKLKSKEDASYQIDKSIDKFEKVFGKKPKGLWPSEHCISKEMLNLVKEKGFEWTISDEGVLAKSLDKEFIRNFDGILKNPYDLCNSYYYGNGKNSLNIIFRSSFLANLISFQYGSHDPKIAANDLYERIKTAQATLSTSPDDSHIVTIAMDCENCWESYQKDGRPFLKHLYKLLSEDKAMDVTTVSDYLSKIDKNVELKKVHSGSWINRNFQMWIGDPTKNLAWDYLHETKKDLIRFSKEDYDNELLEKAWDEFHIALGSDWFWWFGEPNDSGQDELFDLLFRKHLVKIYQILEQDIPDYLSMPLENVILKPSFTPKNLISPKIDGDIEIDGWIDASVIQNRQAPVYNVEKLFKKIYFGNDHNNIYFRFDVDSSVAQDVQREHLLGQIFIYFQGLNNNPTSSYVRAKATTDAPSGILKHPYSHEIEIPIVEKSIMPLIFSKSIENSLWKVLLRHGIKFKHDKVIEMAIPFDEINIKSGEKVNITLLTAKSSIIDEVITLDKPITFLRP